MFNLSLTACSFYIKKAYSKNLEKIYNLNHELICEIDNTRVVKFKNVMDIFRDFFHQYAHNINDNDLQRTFGCSFTVENQGETNDYYYMYAVIYSGMYGSSSEIYDTITQTVTYNKKPTEAERRPFYFFIVIPKDNDRVTVQKGMFFFQNVGTYGVKTVTTEYLSTYFSKNYKISLNCSTIAPQLFINKVLTKENIKKLIMVKNHKSDDIADSFSVGYGEETRVIANLSFSESVWNKIFNGIHHCTKGKYNLFEFESKEYDDLKVVATIGDRERVIDLHNIENLSIIEGIPDDIKMPDGHPNKQMLIEHLKKVSNEYLKEMVLQISK